MEEEAEEDFYPPGFGFAGSFFVEAECQQAPRNLEIISLDLCCANSYNTGRLDVTVGIGNHCQQGIDHG